MEAIFGKTYSFKIMYAWPWTFEKIYKHYYK